MTPQIHIELCEDGDEADEQNFKNGYTNGFENCRQQFLRNLEGEL